MRFKIILITVALAAFFSPIGASDVKNPAPFRTVIPMQVICLPGAPGVPGGMFELLLNKYNEQPVHAMNLSMNGVSIQMYISENKNNPSSSVMLYSNRANQTCIFWTAEDFLRTIEVDNLPAKQPAQGETDA